jgi:hypothetical protein
MPGLDPGIHAFSAWKDVDDRDKPGHDASCVPYAAARFDTERTPSLNSFTNVVTASTLREVARS